MRGKNGIAQPLRPIYGMYSNPCKPVSAMNMLLHRPLHAGRLDESDRPISPHLCIALLWPFSATRLQRRSIHNLCSIVLPLKHIWSKRTIYWFKKNYFKLLTGHSNSTSSEYIRYIKLLRCLYRGAYLNHQNARAKEKKTCYQQTFQNRLMTQDTGCSLK